MKRFPKAFARAAALAALAAAVAMPMAARAQVSGTDAMNKAGCMACHAKDRKLVGPSFQDIAAKYKGQADAPAKLAGKVRAGGKGVFGPIPMPPHGADKIGDAELAAAIQVILGS